MFDIKIWRYVFNFFIIKNKIYIKMGNTLCSSHNNVGLEGYHYDEDLL